MCEGGRGRGGGGGGCGGGRAGRLLTRTRGRLGRRPEPSAAFPRCCTHPTAVASRPTGPLRSRARPLCRARARAARPAPRNLPRQGQTLLREFSIASRVRISSWSRAARTPQSHPAGPRACTHGRQSRRAQEAIEVLAVCLYHRNSSVRTLTVAAIPPGPRNGSRRRARGLRGPLLGAGVCVWGGGGGLSGALR